MSENAKKKPSKKVIIAIIVIIAAVIAALCVYFIPRATSDGYDYLNYGKYINLGKYKGLTYTKQSSSVSDKEVKQEIDSRLQAAAKTKTVKSGKVKKGDTVNIDYVGRIDGKTFTGGSAKNQDVVIGSGSFIDGFESGLIGKSVGSSVKLHLKFPKNYSNKDVAGKKVVFTVQINALKKSVTPTYNKNFIETNSKYDNKADYEAYIRKDLKKKKEESAKSSETNEIWNKIITNTKVKKYPQKQLQAEKDRTTKQYKKIAKQYGMSWKKFLSQYMHTNEAGFKKQINASAKATCKQKMTAYAIMDKEHIKFTKSDYNKKLNETLKNANFTRKTFKKQYNESIEDYAKENDFRSQFILEKVLDHVLTESKAN